MTSPNTIIADMNLVETNLRQQIAHLNDEVAGLKSDVAYVEKQRDEYKNDAADFRGQVNSLTEFNNNLVSHRDELLVDVETLRKQRDELLVEKQWISVSDKMPEDRVKVLCAMTDGSIEVLSHTPASKAVKYPHDLRWHGRGASCIAFIAAEKQVTHWMPLPDFPSANAKGEPC